MAEAKSQQFQFTGTVAGRYDSRNMAGTAAAPATPVITATSIVDGISVSLSSYSADTQTMTLQRATNSGFTTGLTTLSSSLTPASFPYTNSSLSAVTYYYRLSATGEGGTSSYSSTVSAAPLIAPTVTAARVNDTTVRFSFSGGSGATSWTAFYRTPAGSGSYVQASLTVGQASYDVTVSSGSNAQLYLTVANGAASASTTAVIGSAASGGDLPEPNLLRVTFESGTLNAPSSPAPSINTVGFAWGSSNKISIVTGGPGSNRQLWPSAITVNDSRNWTAKDGANSMRIRFPGDASQIGVGEIIAEQRWSMTTPQRDLWVGYWLRVPTNYYNDPSNANSKFFAMWMDDYTAVGSGMVWNMRPKSDGGSVLLLSVANDTQSPGGAGAEVQISSNFINIPADRGVWFRIVLHAVAATTTSSNDGYIETYFKRESESSFTQATTRSSLDIGWKGSGPNGWAGGYILGSHRGYAADTEFLLDNFELSTEPLV